MSPREKVSARHAERAAEKLRQIQATAKAWRAARKAVPTLAKVSVDPRSAPALYEVLGMAKAWLRPGPQGGAHRWVVGVWIFGSIIFGLTDDQLEALALEQRTHNKRVISAHYWPELLAKMESADERELARAVDLAKDLRKPLKEMASAIRRQLRTKVIPSSPATAKGLRLHAWRLIAKRGAPLNAALLWFVEGIEYKVDRHPIQALNTHHITHYINGGSPSEEVEDAIRRAYQARAGGSAWTWDALDGEARSKLDLGHANKSEVCACKACELARVV